MGVFDIFSRRAKQKRGEVIDVYQYTEIPYKLRTQIVLIDKESKILYNDSGYERIVNILRKEYGVFQLVEGNFIKGGIRSQYYDYRAELFEFFLNEENHEHVLDVIELLLRFTKYIGNERGKDYKVTIEEINIRLKEAGVGYEYVEKELIKIDDKLIHQETVKPAIQFLNEERFEGARDEFLGAFDSYKRSEYKDSLVDCLRAMESTLKAIFDIKGWDYNRNANAKALIKVAFDNNLIPEFWQNHFGYLDKLLECSVPVGRNKLGGHGQGSEVVEVPEEIVSYMLHMTASTIVFLVKASKSK